MNIVLLSFHQHLLASKPPHTIIMADILQVFFVAHRVRSFFSHFLSFFENRQTRKYLNWIEAFLLILCSSSSSPTQFCCNALFWIALKDNEQILSDWNFYRITDYCPDWYLHGDEEKEREWKKHNLLFTLANIQCITFRETIFILWFPEIRSSLGSNTEAKNFRHFVVVWNH